MGYAQCGDGHGICTMRGREGNSRACWKTAGFGNQLPEPPGKVASSWPVLTDTGSGETPLPNSVRTDTSGSSSICIYTLPKTTPSGKRVAYKPIRSPGARAYIVRIPTLEQHTHKRLCRPVELIASVCVGEAHQYKHTGLPSPNIHRRTPDGCNLKKKGGTSFENLRLPLNTLKH